MLEEGGRFGEHALAILSEIADIGAQTGKRLKAPDAWSCSNPKAASAYWVRSRWTKQEVSGWLQQGYHGALPWLQVTMSDTLLRQTSRASSVYGSESKDLS